MFLCITHPNLLDVRFIGSSPRVEYRHQAASTCRCLTGWMLDGTVAQWALTRAFGWNYFDVGSFVGWIMTNCQQHGWTLPTSWRQFSLVFLSSAVFVESPKRNARSKLGGLQFNEIPGPGLWKLWALPRESCKVGKFLVDRLKKGGVLHDPLKHRKSIGIHRSTPWPLLLFWSFLFWSWFAHRNIKHVFEKRKQSQVEHKTSEVSAQRCSRFWSTFSEQPQSFKCRCPCRYNYRCQWCQWIPQCSGTVSPMPYSRCLPRWWSSQCSRWKDCQHIRCLWSNHKWFAAACPLLHPQPSSGGFGQPPWSPQPQETGSMWQQPQATTNPPKRRQTQPQSRSHHQRFARISNWPSMVRWPRYPESKRCRHQIFSAYGMRILSTDATAFFLI